MVTGYDTALELAQRKLEAMTPEAVCSRCGVLYADGEYCVPWFGTAKPLSSGSVADRIIWMHYMISEGTKKPSGRYIAYREMDGALFYESKFVQRAVLPFTAYFGKRPEALDEAGRLCNGRPAQVGDYSVTVDALPFVPLTFFIWAGDDEFPPEGGVLFDETARGWLCSEDAVVLAGLAVSEMVRVHQGIAAPL